VIFNDQLRMRAVIVVGGAIVLYYAALRAFAPDLTAVMPPSTLMRAIEAANLIIPFTALALVSVYFRAASVEVEAEMQALAMTDALTKLPNRRHMRDLLDRACAQFARSQAAFGVVMGDIDGFKQINDTRGHECGDHVLRTLATTLRARLRTQDVAARWGGEEFIFLLPQTDLAGAAALAEKLRDAIANEAIVFRNEPVRVTMTFGVSAFADRRSVDDCVRLADAALYAGKGEGKNRVVVEAKAA
jgi:diguanylate cyclase (GGDEF)-like protein